MSPVLRTNVLTVLIIKCIRKDAQKIIVKWSDYRLLYSHVNFINFIEVNLLM